MTTTRPIFEIANDIRRVWGSRVNYAAAPYLDALTTIGASSDRYGQDEGDELILRFLSNASGFRGEAARTLKAELKTHVA